MNTVKLFFSWQSDIPQQRSYLLNALQSAVSRFDFDIEIVEATAGSVGSPRIDEKLFENIDKCSIFFGDITIVNDAIAPAPTVSVTTSVAAMSASDPDMETCPNTRPCPNPNVLTEVGYALSKLGFDHVVLLANTEFGALESLPFDLRNRRCMGFSAKKSLRKNPPTALVDAMQNAIIDILATYPLQVRKFLLNCGPDGAKNVSAMSVAADSFSQYNGFEDFRLYFTLEIGMGSKASHSLEEFLSGKNYAIYKAYDVPTGTAGELATIIFRENISAQFFATSTYACYIKFSTIVTHWPKVTKEEHEGLHGPMLVQPFHPSDPHFVCLVRK